jgi:hypothetical protein
MWAKTRCFFAFCHTFVTKFILSAKIRLKNYCKIIANVHFDFWRQINKSQLTH